MLLGADNDDDGETGLTGVVVDVGERGLLPGITTVPGTKPPAFEEVGDDKDDVTVTEGDVAVTEIVLGLVGVPGVFGELGPLA